MFSEGELPYINRIRFNGSSPFCFRPRTKSPKILSGKVEHDETGKIEKLRRDQKKKGKVTCLFVNTGTRSLPFFRSAALIPPSRAQSPVAHPLSTYFLQSQLPLTLSSPFSIPRVLFSQYRNRSRTGAWRCAIYVVHEEKSSFRNNHPTSRRSPHSAYTHMYVHICRRLRYRDPWIFSIERNFLARFADAK